MHVPRLRAVLAGAGALAALGAVLLTAAPAAASLGSVPAEVSSYVSGGGLVARLTDLYGPNKTFTRGTVFDASTRPGPISRVYEWTAARYADPASDHPIQLTNDWVVPISIADRPVGVATIWINPQTVLPELASYSSDAGLATVLGQVPADAALVHDQVSGAWFGLSGSTVTPLVPGRSGLTTPAPVDQLALTAPSPVAEPVGEPDTGLGVAIAVIVLLVIVIVVALLVAGRRSGRRPAIAAEEPVAAEPRREPEPVVESVAPAGPRVRTSRVAAAKPAAAKPPAAKSPVAKPAVSKPPTSKPPTSKPPTSKPPTSKPHTSKPPTSKPAAARPAGSKPPVRKPPASRPPRPPEPPEDASGERPEQQPD